MKQVITMLLLIFSLVSAAQENLIHTANVDSFTVAKQLAQEAEELCAQYNLDEAEKKYAEAIEYYPRYFNYYVAYMEVCKSIQNYEKAIPVLTKGVELMPAYDELWFYLAQSYKKTGKPITAIDYYSKAIEIIEERNDPLFIHYAYYQNRSNCYLKSREYEKMVADLTKAITINPKSSQLYMNRAKAYLNLRNKEQACADWNTAWDIGNKAALPYLEKVCGK